MTPKEFTELLAIAIWPITAWVAALLLWKPLKKLLERLADTLTPKNVKLKLLGVEVDLTPAEVKNALEEVLRDIARSTSELSESEKVLFERIRISAGAQTVEDIFPSFARGSTEHAALQKLRRLNLILPIEGSYWSAEKHPTITEFGRIVSSVISKSTP